MESRQLLSLLCVVVVCGLKRWNLVIFPNLFERPTAEKQFRNIMASENFPPQIVARLMTEIRDLVRFPPGE